MKKFIKIKHGTGKKIEKAFNTTAPTVRRALKYENNDIKAVKIRRYAIANCEGVIMEEQV